MSDSLHELRREREPMGLAGKLAGAFVTSKLTPLVIVTSVLLGALAVVVTPREEEPQIKVPMVDVFYGLPGGTPAEVERALTTPLEKALSSLPGVEYVYSTSSPGQGMVIVRFKVGEDPDRALVRVRSKLDSLLDSLPPGAQPPLVKPRSIDDVPVYALTFWSPTLDPVTLRRLAAEVERELKTLDDVSDTVLIGGLRRQLRVELDPDRLAARGLSLPSVLPAILGSHRRSAMGALVADGRRIEVEAGGFLRSAADLQRVVVAQVNQRPVYLGDVATVVDGPEEPATYVTHGERGAPGRWPAVTLSVSKRRGANAIAVVHALERKLEEMRPRLFDRDVRTTVTRNYGETAAEKSNELLEHMGIATLSVALLIGLALGRREAGVVLLAIPVTLALTLFTFTLLGYTLNRITLFALIFSIGILVDDAIVVVENIVRHLRSPESKGRSLVRVVIEATDEVGNPTILATVAVIAAILPMGFVGGLMGPYMRPIPIGASAAMVFSLLVAFSVTPWAMRLFLRNVKREDLGHEGDGHGSEGALTRLYRRAMKPLVSKGGRPRFVFFGLLGALLLASMALVPLGVVTVKMLPFDNKSELQIVLDLPDGTPLETTHQALAEMAESVRALPEVTAATVYAGTAAPYNFNGLVRHYFLRSASHQGDVQVTLLPKGERKRSSHEVARQVREMVTPIGKRYAARVKVAEVPPGPPVLQTLVAEVYGPTDEGRKAAAAEVQKVFEATEGVVDVDSYVETPHAKVVFHLDRQKAGQAGIREADVAGVLRSALGQDAVAPVPDPDSREGVPLVVTLPREKRNDLAALSRLRVPNGTTGGGGAPPPAPPGARGVGSADVAAAGLVPLSEIGRFVEEPVATSIYHKNLKPVVYVTADVGGRKEAPVYAIGALNDGIAKVKLPEGQTAPMEVFSATAPFDTGRYAMKWDGEWHVTYEVFRDLGMAFAVVMILIYVLVVGWFKSFRTPLVIMAPIPLTLVGILPAHGLFGVFFTATSMIGFIAGAGIIVRNSIILVDFIELRRSQGMPLAEAVLDAGAVRFRPMLLTAAAVVVGSAVMLLDPIFQGLAVSMMAGEVASTLLSRMAVPVLYYLSERKGEAARLAESTNGLVAERSVA